MIDSHLPASATPAHVKQLWTTPQVTELPRLTELTLQTGPAIPGECGTGGSGSTCF